MKQTMQETHTLEQRKKCCSLITETQHIITDCTNLKEIGYFSTLLWSGLIYRNQIVYKIIQSEVIMHL